MFVTVGLALTAAAILVAAVDYGLWSYGGPGPGMMPAIGGVLMLAASLISLKSDAPSSEGGSYKSAALSIVGMALVVPATALLGLLGALAGYCLLSLRVVDRVPLLRSGLITLGIVGGSWLLFAR